MKILFLLTFLVPATLFSNAQVSNSIPYQAVVRNTDGSPMASTSVTMILSIHNLSATGDVVYQEAHSTTTNTQGLVSLSIGSGTPVTGNFSAINWGSGAKFLQVAMNAGNGNIDLGTQQIMSVPYALYAEDVNVRVSTTGDTLFIGNNYSIVPGVSAANPLSTSNYGSVLLPGNTTCQNEYISVTGCGGQDSLLYYDRYYSLVEIGGQCWFAENLATHKYSNGDDIPTGLLSNDWQSTSSGAFTTYNNLAANGQLYGNLYNWFTTQDSRGVCPVGWHVPSSCDMEYLSVALGGELVSGAKLKSNLFWSNNVYATNESGFTAKPAGFCNYLENFYFLGGYAYFWTKDGIDSVNAYGRNLLNNNSYFSPDVNNKRNGQSIRCIKD